VAPGLVPRRHLLSVTVRNLAYHVFLEGDGYGCRSRATDDGGQVAGAKEWRLSGIHFTVYVVKHIAVLCCALPSLFVLIGLGATVASAVSSVPLLITFSRHKNWTFAIAGLLILANFVYVYRIAPRLRAESKACPIDQPSACGSASRMSRWTLWLSAAIYLVGFFSAYLLGPILRVFE